MKKIIAPAMAGQKIYHYHQKTGEYLKVSDAREDPRVPGRFLIPAFATVDVPITPELGSVAVFQNGWGSVIDKRGTVIYRKDDSSVSETLAELGDIPNEWTDLIPVGIVKWDGSEWIPDTDAIAVKDAETARKAAKAQALIDNLPSWAQVDNAIDNISSLAEAKAFIRKLTRVTYWLAKGTKK